MQQEIETRFLGVDKAKLIADLRALGAEDLGEVRLEEMTFDPQDDLRGPSFIRLRKKGDSIVLTYKNKHPKEDYPRELEFGVTDMSKCAQLLSVVGWQQMRKLEKLRHTFRFGEVTIDIDTWPKIPTYVEFEGPTVESIKEASAKLGFDWETRCDGDAKNAFHHYGHDMLALEMITFEEFR